MQQTHRIAGPIQFVANECEPFQANRLGLEHVSIGNRCTILDVGCGGGRTVDKLAAIATQGKVYGIDYSGESVAATKKTNGRWIALELSDGRIKREQHKLDYNQLRGLSVKVFVREQHG